MVVSNLLDPVLRPLLNLHIFWVVAILSTGISLIITIVYKLMTDQNLMKQLKDEMKELQNEMKELRNNPEQMMEVQRKAMQTNSKYMMQSMKSTLITFIPIILIFGWMNANIAYEPLTPNIEFTLDAAFNNAHGKIKLEAPNGITVLGNDTQEIVNNKATWILKGDEGEYTLNLTANHVRENKDLLITNEQAYKEPLKTFRNSILKLKTIQINHDPKTVLPMDVNLLGYRGGWLGTYIIISILTSMLLRKLLKVY